MQSTREIVRRGHFEPYGSADSPQSGSIRILGLPATMEQTSAMILPTGSILRRGNIISLALARQQLPCRDRTAHQSSPATALPSRSTLLPSLLLASPLNAERNGASEQRVDPETTRTRLTTSPPVIITSEIPEEPSSGLVKQGTYTPATKMGRSRYSLGNETGPDRVIFYWRSGEGVHAVSVARILTGTRSRTSLDGAHEPVLQHHGVNVTLHILWPGHMPWSTLVRTKSWKDPTIPISRAELASRLARALARFTASATRDVESSSAPSTTPFPSQIVLKELHLISFYQVTKGSWQVELAVGARTPGDA